MVRRVINVLSPVAALAVVWVSLQGFVFSEAPAAEALLGQPTTLTQDGLPSVTHILAATASHTLGESVPDSVKRILIANGTVLLVPEQPDNGSGL